jgi:glycosyltransferase involved in cell wall biosynthesis
VSSPDVSVIVPARQEASDIVACLEAIAAQDLPRPRFEVIVVDGGSSDGTAEVARQAVAALDLDRATVLVNPEGSTSSNLNVGLAAASGEVVCRVDARTRIEPHYVSTCLRRLHERPDVAVVGGAQIAIARTGNARDVGIARALNNRWSMGGSAYRRQTASGPSDTVYLGAFRRAQLSAVGGWDEALISNQDFDLNRRMASEGLVWFEASLRSGYVPRAGLGQLWRQYRRFGRAKVRYWRHTGAAPQPRQWVLIAGPPIVAAALVGGLAATSGPWRALVGLAALGTAVTVEGTGTTEPAGGVAARGASVAAMGVVTTAWWLGVVQEAITPSREPLGSDLRAPAS